MKGHQKKSLLLIGAGPTSALICYNIGKNQILKDALNIKIWEKSSGIGGRFSTFQSPNNPKCMADLGAQYLTQSRPHPSSHAYFENLKIHKLIRPLATTDIPGFRSDDAKQHYACVIGAASIVKHFFDQASVNRNDQICFNSNITRLQPVMSSSLVEATTDTDIAKRFDFIISTIPAPELLQLTNFSQLVTEDDVRRNLEAVKYSSRFALGIFFNDVKMLKTTCGPMNFVDNHKVIRYWSVENRKRTGDWKEPTSVVFHTSIGHGVSNIDRDEESVKNELRCKAQDFLPEIQDIPENSIICHKWRFSQVMEPFLGRPGCVRITNQIFAAGDAFCESGFEGCIVSAEKTILALQSALNL